MRADYLGTIILGFVVMLMTMLLFPSNIYRYEGRASFFPDTVNNIMAYDDNLKIIGVSDLNVNMLDISFNFIETEDIPYLISYRELDDKANTYNVVAKITAFTASGLLMIVGLIEIIRSRRSKLDKKLGIKEK